MLYLARHGDAGNNAEFLVPIPEYLAFLLKFSAESDEKEITMRVAGPDIIIKNLFQRKIGGDSFRSYRTVQSNGRYPSLRCREDWSAESCPHDWYGSYGRYDVVAHEDFGTHRLFSEVVVLQAEFEPRPEQPPLFFLRSDVLIEPFDGKLHMIYSEDYRRQYGSNIFVRDQNLWDLYRSGIFDESKYPHLKKMFETFAAIAAAEPGFIKFWGMGDIPRPRWEPTDETESVRPIVDFPFAPTGRVLREPKAVIARLREIGERRMTRELAQELYGVSGTGNLQSREANALRRRVVKLIHPDRNKDPGVELWLKQLNDAFDLLKDPPRGR